MKNKQRSLKLALHVAFFGMGAFLLSCKSASDPINAEITQTANNELTQDAQQDEVDDMATGQLNAGDGAGRLTASDSRVACAYVIFEDTIGGKGQGTLTINFNESANGSANAAGCTDARGNVRKGIITITWSGGRWWKVGSTITIHLMDYSINGVVINGTRTLTNVSTVLLIPTWTISSNVTSTWPDSTKATRTVNKTRAWNIAEGTVTTTQTSGFSFAASGTNRHGKTYTVQITNPIVYSEACIAMDKVYFPVSGTKVIIIDTNKEITMDFGNGTCDQTCTITYSGKSTTLTAKNDDSND
jgi:hypothetical protein